MSSSRHCDFRDTDWFEGRQEQEDCDNAVRKSEQTEHSQRKVPDDENNGNGSARERKKILSSVADLEAVPVNVSLYFLSINQTNRIVSFVRLTTKLTVSENKNGLVIRTTEQNYFVVERMED